MGIGNLEDERLASETCSHMRKETRGGLWRQGGGREAPGASMCCLWRLFSGGELLGARSTLSHRPCAQVYKGPVRIFSLVMYFEGRPDRPAGCVWV